MKTLFLKKGAFLIAGVFIASPSVIFASEEESITESVIKFSAQHYFLTAFIVLVSVGLLARYLSKKSNSNQSGKIKRGSMRVMLRRRKRIVINP
jgi:hypothetical protein